VKKKKILIVEDSPTLRRIIMSTLLEAGYAESIESDNGVDALAKIREYDFDLIITDWDMPRMNGLELVRNLKNNKKCQSIPLVMISTRNDPDDIRLARESGVNTYLTKPFDPGNLIVKIKEFI